VQIAAVSEDQTDNTYGAIYGMLTANGGRAADELAIDVGRTRLFHPSNGGELHPVTSSKDSREGARVTFAVLDETHLWTPTNGGVKLAATLRRNAGKMNGRTIETTNAPTIGGKSVAERSESDVERGFAGILHYAIRPEKRPEPDWPDDQLLEALKVAYGDAYWVDLGRLLKEIRDPANDWDDSLRFYFNIRTVGAGRAVDPRRWEELNKPRDIAAGSLVGLGFDGSVSQDATVLRACTPDGYSFILGLWQRSPDDPPEWSVPRSEVHKAVDAAFARYKVGRMFCDPWKWHSEIEEWTVKYGEDSEGDPRVVVLDTNQASKFTPAVDRWLTGIREGSHTHDGDPLTSDHVKSAHLKQVRLADDPAGPATCSSRARNAAASTPPWPMCWLTRPR
jgi:phage terminase large subunit-like protein